MNPENAIFNVLRAVVRLLVEVDRTDPELRTTAHLGALFCLWLREGLVIVEDHEPGALDHPEEILRERHHDLADVFSALLDEAYKAGNN